jgi:aminoglycoside phosphotransferase (APT) family kinase protein
VAEEALKVWLTQATGDPGPFTLRPLAGGNSNETLAVTSERHQWIVRRPPAAALAPSAHAMDREYRILCALQDLPVPTPRPIAMCTDPAVPQTPALLMQRVDGVALTDTLPESYPQGAEGARVIGEALVDALVRLHSVDWQNLGLADFGRPDGFLERQVPRWRRQLEQYRIRALPWLDELTGWLEDHRPASCQPGILHGDFHLDNCLLTPHPPVSVAAILDWEMATIGDPLLDLGIFLAFWGSARPDRPAMPQVQAVSRAPGAPCREELAERYRERTGRRVEHLTWYMTFSLWKLAIIVEAAYAQFVHGRLRTPYAAALEHDVPRLLNEAASLAGLRPGALSSPR